LLLLLEFCGMALARCAWGGCLELLLWEMKTERQMNEKRL
jgi:hypothetical protein